MNHFISKAIALSLFLFSFNAVFAGEIKCPTTEELNMFKLEASFPYGYNKYTKSMQTIAIASSREMQDRVFVLYPLAVAAGEKPNDRMHAVIEHLQSESDMSFSYPIARDLPLQICAYTLPESHHINALLYIDDREQTEPEDFQVGQKRHQRFVEKLMKQFVIK